MPLPLRASIAWLALMAVEVVHGTARALWVAPAVGERASRQWGVLSGSLLLFAATLAMARWLRPGRRALAVGTGWAAATAAFELALGRAFGRAWPDLLSDFDLPRGGMMPFGLLAMALAPALAARLRHRL